MAAKARPDKSAPRRWTYAKLITLLAVIVLFVGGLIWAGRWGLEQLRGHERYDVPFADIECAPPVGMERRAFLDEVRYANRLPAQLHLLDDELPRKLRHEFLQHPWVETVEDVTIIPPKRVVVTLKHRVPVLAVRVDGALRAVDGGGFLLPTNAPTLRLPVYDGDAKAPAGAGKRWGDPNVEEAARRLKK